MAKDLVFRLESGQYDHVVDVEEFATRLTDHMRELSNDEHLNFFYSNANVTTEEDYMNPSSELQGENVMILTSEATFSAAEAFSYAMQAFGRAEIVGEKTRGGAHPGGIQRIADHFYLWVSNGKAINAVTGENWEGTGVSPDYPATAEAAFTSLGGTAIDSKHLRSIYIELTDR